MLRYQYCHRSVSIASMEMPTGGPIIKLVDLFKLIVTGLSLVYCLVIRDSADGFVLLKYFSGVVSHPRVLQVSQYVSVESSSLTHHRPYS